MLPPYQRLIFPALSKADQGPHTSDARTFKAIQTGAHRNDPRVVRLVYKSEDLRRPSLFYSTRIFSTAILREQGNALATMFQTGHGNPSNLPRFLRPYVTGHLATLRLPDDPRWPKARVAGLTDGPESNRPFISCSWIDGVPFNKACFPADPLPILRGLLQLINDLHKHGFAYGDLKPGNLLYSENIPGNVAMIDMDTLRYLGGKDHEDCPLSTEKWRAPEQLRGELWKKTDIYAFGQVMLELFKASLPEFYQHMLALCMDCRLDARPTADQLLYAIDIQDLQCIVPARQQTTTLVVQDVENLRARWIHRIPVGSISPEAVPDGIRTPLDRKHLYFPQQPPNMVLESPATVRIGATEVGFRDDLFVPIVCHPPMLWAKEAPVWRDGTAEGMLWVPGKPSVTASFRDGTLSWNNPDLLRTLHAGEHTVIRYSDKEAPGKLPGRGVFYPATARQLMDWQRFERWEELPRHNDHLMLSEQMQVLICFRGLLLSSRCIKDEHGTRLMLDQPLFCDGRLGFDVGPFLPIRTDRLGNRLLLRSDDMQALVERAGKGWNIIEGTLFPEPAAFADHTWIWNGLIWGTEKPKPAEWLASPKVFLGWNLRGGSSWYHSCDPFEGYGWLVAAHSPERAIPLEWPAQVRAWKLRAA